MHSSAELIIEMTTTSVSSLFCQYHRLRNWQYPHFLNCRFSVYMKSTMIL